MKWGECAGKCIPTPRTRTRLAIIWRASRTTRRASHDARPCREPARAPVVPRYMARTTRPRLVRVRRTYSCACARGKLPCASGRYSTQEAGTRKGPRTVYVQSSCACPRGKLPCASGTYSPQEAGTRSPYVQYGGSGAYVSAQASTCEPRASTCFTRHPAARTWGVMQRA